MSRSFLHHLDLTVGDVERSFPIYDLFLRHAGFESKGCTAEIAGWNVRGRDYPYITLLKVAGDNADRQHDRYSAGLHHLALAAESREDVDHLYSKLVAAGVNILNAPAAYPEYGNGYYALFFTDCDGIKLEYAWTPAAVRSEA